jgi:hypothetical protein
MRKCLYCGIITESVDKQTKLCPKHKGERVHELKTWPDSFCAIWEYPYRKNFEIRKDDRGFLEGDLLILREFLPESNTYSGRVLKTTVAYIARGVYGLPPGLCVMALSGGQNRYLKNFPE